MANISLCFKWLIGISFLSVMADMIMLEGNFKKYVRTILGLVMLLVMIHAFTGIRNVSFDFSFPTEESASEETKQEISDALVLEVRQRIEDKVRAELGEEQISMQEIRIDLDKDFALRAICLRLQSAEDIPKARKILTEKLKVDGNIISFS